MAKLIYFSKITNLQTLYALEQMVITKRIRYWITQR